MDATRFDTIAKLFARRRLSRRQAVAQGSAGLAAGALAAVGLSAPARAQDAAQDTEQNAAQGPTMLFLQAFQVGSVAPKDGAEARYVLTLEQGLGHTVYFSDRPHRIVGVTPTPEFLAGLGFPDDNPPNAALVVEGAAGETEIAVLALYAPEYDVATRTATYEAEVLQGWERSLAEGFVEASADLAALLPQFGAAHLFIDDCPAHILACIMPGNAAFAGYIYASEHHGYCWSDAEYMCLPCDPWKPAFSDALAYWTDQCNKRFAACSGACGIQM